eukprot:4660583-Pyramimonas_sp.AAC.1
MIGQLSHHPRPATALQPSRLKCDAKQRLTERVLVCVRAPSSFKTDAVKYTGSRTYAMPHSGGFHSRRYRYTKEMKKKLGDVEDLTREAKAKTKESRKIMKMTHDGVTANT